MANLEQHVNAAPQWRQRLPVLLSLAPTYILAVLFWRVPVSEPLTISALLVDRVLQVATASLLPVCFLMLVAGSVQWARWAAVASALVALALGGSVTFAALTAPIDAWPTVLSLASLGGGGGVLIYTKAYRLVSLPRAVSIAGIFAVLPILQFWHATSYVPARLTPTVGADASVTGRITARGDAIGEVEVIVRNDGPVGARMLASELIMCYWPGPHEFLSQDEMYDSDNCRTEQVFENLSEINSQSAWTLRHAFQQPAAKDQKYRIAQAVVLLWFARMDRLRIGDAEYPIPKIRRENCRDDGELLSYVVQEDSRVQGVVQRDRRLVYLRPDVSGDAYFALTTVQEPGCMPPNTEDEGLPRSSEYDLQRRVGLSELRLNHEAWLDSDDSRLEGDS